MSRGRYTVSPALSTSVIRVGVKHGQDRFGKHCTSETIHLEFVKYTQISINAVITIHSN